MKNKITLETTAASFTESQHSLYFHVVFLFIIHIAKASQSSTSMQNSNKGVQTSSQTEAAYPSPNTNQNMSSMLTCQQFFFTLLLSRTNKPHSGNICLHHAFITF